MKTSKLIVTLITFVLCVLSLCACGENAAEEISMGRYAEREIYLPGSGYEYMHPLSDGGYYLQGNGVDFTKVDNTGKVTTKSWAWENNYNVRLKTVFGIDDNGAVIFAFLPRFYTDEELAVLGTEDEIYYKYYYVDEHGERHLLSLHGDEYSPKEFFVSFAFAPDGNLYGATERHVCHIDLDSEEVKPLFETSESVSQFAFIDSTMISVSRHKVYLYDTVSQKPLDDNTILNDFLNSHQSGSIVIAAGNDEEQALYLGCQTGLYRYIWGGSIIEQIADGQMLSLGNTQYRPLALQVLDNEEFRILYSGNHMVEMYYDETLPARPSKTLTVYSLEENPRIRYAGQLFQKQHPDVLVTYETGIDGDSAVSKEDALKNLNTKLLAGEGPDVLILDDLDIEQYARKGVLKELDSFLLPYKEEGSLYQNLVEGMRMTETDKIYSVPLSVYIPLYLSETKYLDGQTTLPDLVEGAAFARKEHPEGPILFAPAPGDLLDELLPVCIPEWTASDGSLVTEKVTEFYQTADALWQTDNAGMDETARKIWQEENDYDDRLYISSPTAIHRYVPFDKGDPETWMLIGFANDPFENMRSLHLTYSAFRETGGYLDFKQIDDVYAMGYGKYGGQAQDVYWANSIVGLCEKAKEPELAEDFLTLLLSDDMMRRCWLGKGFPIRKESLAKILDINNKEMAQVLGWDAGIISTTYADYTWPTDEEKAQIYQILEEATCPYIPDSILEQSAKEIGLRVLDGELTPEEGTIELQKKMQIEMEE